MRKMNYVRSIAASQPTGDNKLMINRKFCAFKSLNPAVFTKIMNNNLVAVSIPGNFFSSVYAEKTRRGSFI